MTHLALFETPVFLFEHAARADADAELARRLVVESEVEPGLVVSNRGGWHSTPDLAQRPDPLLRELAGQLVARVREATASVVDAHGEGAPPPLGMALTAWAMVMRDGDYTTLHDHPESTWSLAYYLDPGDADAARHPDSGVLTLVDPRRAAPVVHGLTLFPTSFRVTPAAGLLVVFPSYLQHYVSPYRGQRPRVMIAANARLRGPT